MALLGGRVWSATLGGTWGHVGTELGDAVIAYALPEEAAQVAEGAP